MEGRAIRKLVGMWKEGIVTLKRSIDLLGSIWGMLKVLYKPSENNFFLILPSLHSTFYSSDSKTNINLGFVLDNKPLPSPFPLV